MQSSHGSQLRFIASVTLLIVATTAASAEDPREAALSPDVWRREKRIIDLHLHVEGRPERFERALKILDQAGVGLGVNLGAGTTSHKEGELSSFEATKLVGDKVAPGRFVHSMLLDYSGWDEPGWTEKAVRDVEAGYQQGAVGLKEFKRLGLFLKDKSGALIKIDDPKLDPVWARCGELGMPVSIHVGDPKAFWLPYDEKNERWTELKDHKSWWFGDPAKYPPRMELLEALDRVIARHPQTTFICVHFANNPEELEWVDAALTRRPNMMADIAARIPEVGRHDPAKVRELFIKHQDRILFATDFMVYSKLILGSGGDADQPSDQDADLFYRKCWRWFETADRDWPHMTPIQGNWTISSIDLPREVCRKIYFDNARRVLPRTLPLPSMTAKFMARDFVPDGILDEPEWEAALPTRLEYQSNTVVPHPHLSTPVRALWSDQFLYLAFEAPYTELSTFSPVQKEERLGLWDKDVVEAFITPPSPNGNSYTEYEWAPTGEQLDVDIDLPTKKDFAWSSGMESSVKIDEAHKIWRVEVRIPWSALGGDRPSTGVRWRANFFRCDKANNAYLAFSPTLRGTFHAPDRFGWLVFVE